jgi:hypothetical protein
LSCPLTLALFQIPLAANKNSQQNISILGKICCYFDELALRKQTSRRPKAERD